MAIEMHFTFAFFFIFTMKRGRVIQMYVTEDPLTGIQNR